MQSPIAPPQPRTYLRTASFQLIAALLITGCSKAPTPPTQTALPPSALKRYDLTNHVTLVVWTNLTVSLDEQPTANTLALKVLDQIYTVSPTAAPPSTSP